MVAVRVGVPKKVIEEVGDILNRTVMAGIRLQKKVMSKAFQDQERALDERIRQRKVLIVPDSLAGQAAGPDQEADDKDDCITQPIGTEVTAENAAQRARSLRRSSGWVWVLSVHPERVQKLLK